MEESIAVRMGLPAVASVAEAFWAAVVTCRVLIAYNEYIKAFVVKIALSTFVVISREITERITSTEDAF